MVALWPRAAEHGGMDTIDPVGTHDRDLDLETQALVVGGGPAGLVTGLLLARQGVDVIVLEKHADFLRDFRGDTIHPSTLALLEEIGLLEEFLALPHDRMTRVSAGIGGRVYPLADMRRLPVRCRFVALVPQWDFLELLARAAGELPGFRLLRSSELTDLIVEDGTVVGARVRSPQGERRIRAGAVIGADGRSSRVREAAGLRAVVSGAPMDVLWLRLPRRPDESLPLFSAGAGALICLDRGEYWQVALVVPKGAVAQLRGRRRPMEEVRARIAATRPELADRAQGREWADVHELRVRVDHLPVWHRPGLLCIGDAAHAMSPAGGVGINLAVQDAVATARMLGPVLAERPATAAELDAVRRRRLPAARITQRIQAVGFARLLRPTLEGRLQEAPLPVRVISRLPVLQHLLGRVIGLGVRPERFLQRTVRS